MELRVLKYFLAVAHEQSIVHAAESLHLTQPTLSTQLKALEQELGKQLLIRGTKGSRKVTLTQDGMILKKRAEEILQLVEKTEQEIRSSDDLIIGDICIGTGETEAFRLLAKTAVEIRHQHPGIRCHLSSGNAEYVYEQLDKGLIDFGLVFSEPDRRKYSVLPLPLHDEWGILMPSGSPLASRDSVTPEDLRSLPLILSSESSWNRLSDWLQFPIEELNIAATYNLLNNAAILVEEGLGYAVCLNRIIRTYPGGPLTFRPLSPACTANMQVIWKKYQILSRPAACFLHQLQLLCEK